MTIQATQLRNLTDYDTLMTFLADELDWPMDFYEAEAEDYAFEYTPEELGIDPKHTAKIRSVRQLRPLDDSQPWGVFYLEFDSKQLPIVVLRRILRTLVRKKREAANPAERRVWELRDLLFISAVGTNRRGVTFAYFHENPDGIPQLRTFEWDEGETQFANIIPKLEALHWPSKTSDIDIWRDTWAGAFPARHRYSISTAKELSKAMAELAKRTKEEVLEVYSYESEKTGPLRKLHESFKQALIQDLDKEGFADMLAQTLAYGLFSVRASGAAKIDLSSLSELPKTNPFLQELLTELVNLAGLEEGKIDFDELSVSDLIVLLNEADMFEVLSSFGRTSRGGADDPVVHFYEDFLKEYDAAQKVQRGVFYTPKPVVSFIVRSVHELLQTEFGLADGLADTTTWGEMKAKNADLELPKDVSLDAPFVQILDPATGTGTFLETVIDVIYEHMTAKWRKQGMSEAQIKQMWNEYVPEHLLPRLYGFELMMAPYAVAHLKLGLKLRQTGYSFHSKERLRVFLANTLESARTGRKQQALDIPNFLSHEATDANEVKRSAIITCVVGNPPYSGVSQNMTHDATAIIEPYKFVDGKALGERKHWLHNDYVKFVRSMQQRIENANYGILAFITPRGYLGNVTFRGMRASLTGTFDNIYTLDLHGGVKDKEAAPSGMRDENVFDIEEGVAVSVFVGGIMRSRTSKRHVYHSHLWGRREQKYMCLLENSLCSTNWHLINASSPYYFFFPRQLSNEEEYNFGWRSTEIFPVNNTVTVTARDHFVIAEDKQILKNRIAVFRSLNQSDDAIRTNYFTGKTRSKKYEDGDSRGWRLPVARRVVQRDPSWENRIERCAYRPFDERFIYYADWMIDWSRDDTVMRHMRLGDNLGIVARRQMPGDKRTYFFVSKLITIDGYIRSDNKGSESLFPLYLYHAIEADLDGRRPNIAPSFIRDVADKSGLSFNHKKQGDLTSTFGPEDVFHYIYAVFHSPNYRVRYAEFLNIDFPRVPLTSSLDLFRSLCAKGQALVNLHLMESQISTFTTFPVSGDNLVEKPPRYQEPKGDQPGRVYINKMQYFEGVPPEVWEFYIGGYQVCHKWLKDRKGRTLSTDDITHYQKIVVALSETIRLMTEIDEVIEEYGGWPLVGSVSEEAEV